MRAAWLVVVLLIARVAAADPDLPAAPAAPPQSGSAIADATGSGSADPVEQLFEDGRNLLAAGRAGEACMKFDDALKHDADAAGVMFNLGLCNEQLGNLATALSWYRRAGARSFEQQLTQTEAAAKEHSAALAPRVPTLHVTFTRPPPAGSTVTLDGALLAQEEYTRHELDPGHHSVQLMIPGQPPVVAFTDATEGQAATVTLAVPEPVILHPPVVSFVDAGASQRHHALAIGAIGTGALVASAVIGFVGRSEYRSSEDPSAYTAWRNTVRYGGSALFGVGLAGVVYAGWLYKTAPGMQRVEHAAVAPVVAPGQVGIALTGAF